MYTIPPNSSTIIPTVYSHDDPSFALLFLLSIMVVLFSLGVGIGAACAQLRKKPNYKPITMAAPSYQAVLYEKEAEGIDSRFIPAPHTSSIQGTASAIDTGTDSPGR